MDTLKPHPLAAAMPRATADEDEGLLKSLKDGFWPYDPIIVHEGQILDGCRRYEMCQRLEIPLCPPVIREWNGEGETPEDFILARALARRNLTPAGKKILVETCLRMHPEMSDRAIAAEVKVSHHTVSAKREELEHGGQIAHHEEHTGKDGVKQPARKPRRHAPETPPRPEEVPELPPPANDAQAIKQQRLLAAWNAHKDWRDLGEKFKTLAAEIEALYKSQPVAFLCLKDAVALCGTVWTDIHRSRPFATCPFCQGQEPCVQKCKNCFQHGWMPRDVWNRLPREFKVNATTLGGEK